MPEQSRDTEMPVTGIQVHLEHLTEYRYDRPVRLGPQTIRLRPAAHGRTPVLAYSLDIEPKPHFLNWQQDPFGNFMAVVSFPEPCQRFSVKVGLRADLHRINPFDFFIDDRYRDFPFQYSPDLAAELQPYLSLDESGPRLDAFVASISREPQHVVSLLSTLNQRVNREIRYLLRMEAGVQACESTLELGSGSCRDMAWLLCQTLRRLGIAARFASGYLVQLSPDAATPGAGTGPKSDFVDLHAWVEAYLPGAGWIGLDATSGLFAGEGHLPLSCTPQPGKAAPISGSVEPSQTTMEHRMSVLRATDPPRATQPLSEAQWAAVDAVGRAVDRRLRDLGIGLTMGGEPTYVASDRRDDPQWQIDALGAHKFEKGWQLLQRMRRRFSPNSLAHTGQGKWYGGEVLPRWSLNSFWRADGQPLWTRQALMADPSQPGTIDLDAPRISWARSPPAWAWTPAASCPPTRRPSRAPSPRRRAGSCPSPGAPGATPGSPSIGR